ncbi:hypothetical protein DM806_24070 [Sphingobium lactosutens]|uniref:hypothetical protein n=1 Tax=Sphingobium lactosutens TaxID=522773 RepID=UPI0015BC96F9|nr:hypothetical protein [Sphingobium lactosutens]NWK98683.1 hypothetical protein [Sphingobium lactosutens]
MADLGQLFDIHPNLHGLNAHPTGTKSVEQMADELRKSIDQKQDEIKKVADDALGTRFGLRVTLPPMDTRDQALIVQSRLLRARSDRLRMPWPQPGLIVGPVGAPKVSAIATAGTSLPLKGCTPNFYLREGQFLSINHAGRRYIHLMADNLILDGSGNGVADVWPMLRVGLSVNDVVEIAKPMIEGLVSPGDEVSWQISVDHMASFEFTLAESA